MTGALQRAIASIQAGNKKKGIKLLAQIIQTNPQHEEAWLWMAGVVDSDYKRHECLRRVLTINPHNLKARKALSMLKQKQIRRLKSITLRQNGTSGNVDLAFNISDTPIPDFEALNLAPIDFGEDDILQPGQGFNTLQSPAVAAATASKIRPLKPTKSEKRFAIKPVTHPSMVQSIFSTNPRKEAVRSPKSALGGPLKLITFITGKVKLGRWKRRKTDKKSQP